MYASVNDCWRGSVPCSDLASVSGTYEFHVTKFYRIKVGRTESLDYALERMQHSLQCRFGQHGHIIMSNNFNLGLFDVERNHQWVREKVCPCHLLIGVSPQSIHSIRAWAIDSNESLRVAGLSCSRVQSLDVL